MSIFNTDKLIIFFYRPGAGGRFIANCLGLSSQFILQDQHLAQKQLDNKFDSRQKFDLLLSRLHDVKLRWNDLNLGDTFYFGKALLDVVNESEINSVCKTVCDQNLFFTTFCHEIDEFKSLLKKFPNAKIVSLINDDNFLLTHRKMYMNSKTKYWNQIKATGWPDTAPSNSDEIRALPKNIQQELEYQFNNTIYQYVNRTLDDVCFITGNRQLSFVWDCDWYFDTDTTVNSVEQLYKLLGLTDFNPEWIKIYHREWIKKLQSLAETDTITL